MVDWVVAVAALMLMEGRFPSLQEQCQRLVTWRPCSKGCCGRLAASEGQSPLDASLSALTCLTPVDLLLPCCLGGVLTPHSCLPCPGCCQAAVEVVMELFLPPDPPVLMILPRGDQFQRRMVSEELVVLGIEVMSVAKS